MSKTSNQRVGATIEEIHSKLGIDAALKCHTGTYELLSVIPKQALADDLEKSSYKTKQVRATARNLRYVSSVTELLRNMDYR